MMKDFKKDPKKEFKVLANPQKIVAGMEPEVNASHYSVN